MKNCTIVAVIRTSAVLPMCRHGTEYSTRSTWAWMSGPIFAVAHVASTNGSAGSGRSVSFSTASNTAAGAAPSSGRQSGAPPLPATSGPPRPASAAATRTPGPARNCPGHTASAARPVPWTDPSIAPDPQSASQRVRVTHPFHPLAGREFSLVVRKNNWAEDRVFFFADDGQLTSLPAAGRTWTRRTRSSWSPPAAQRSGWRTCWRWRL